MMTLERTLNDKHFECRVDCLGKLIPSDLNAFFENQASTLLTSFSQQITDVRFVAHHHSFNQLTSLIN